MFWSFDLTAQKCGLKHHSFFQVLLLKDKLLGILVHFDNFLNNESIPIRTKRQVFASLMSLMRIMGPARITEVRLRLMTTLK